MSDVVAIIGCIACPITLVYSIYKIVKVFKINSTNSDLTDCRFTYVLRIRYLIITFLVRYDFEYTVDDIVYTGKALVSPLFGFSENDLENGVLVRYLKSDPNCVEFTNMGHGVRVFGWLIFVAASVIGGFFSFVDFFGL